MPPYKLEDLARNYLIYKSEIEDLQEKAKEAKEKFEYFCDRYFEENGTTSKVFETDELIGSDFKVTKIETTKIEFFPDAVEKNLSKDLSNKVIVKSYKVVNMPKLIEYLKKCGVNPKVFKKFIQVDKKVDGKMLEKFHDLGLITEDQLSECYEVKPDKSYFSYKRLTPKRK